MTDWNLNDPDAVRVLYDLSAWNFEQQAELSAEMADADIPHGWIDTELAVPEEFESITDALLSRLELRLGIVSGRITMLWESSLLYSLLFMELLI